MENEELGKADCPICGNSEAVIRKSGKSSKPYMVCGGVEGCGYQGFARGQKAVEKMLQKLTPALPAAPEKKGFFDGLI